MDIKIDGDKLFKKIDDLLLAMSSDEVDPYLDYAAAVVVCLITKRTLEDADQYVDWDLFKKTCAEVSAVFQELIDGAQNGATPRE